MSTDEKQYDWYCIFESTEKCRWIGLLQEAPQEYDTFCLCCRLLSVQEEIIDQTAELHRAIKVATEILKDELKDIYKEIKNLAASLAEFCVLMLKFPALQKLKPTEAKTDD